MEKIPKRIKSKDNPYRFEFISNDKWITKFMNNNKEIEVEINDEVYLAMNKFELTDKKQMNEEDRHIEKFKSIEESLTIHDLYTSKSAEDEYIKKYEKEELERAINKLPDIQKRRIKKYFFDKKTEQEIAEVEKVKQQSIHLSLIFAKENLKKLLKNKI